MAEAAIRKNVLYTYKNLLKMARGLPEAKRDQSLKSIKEGFRINVGEVDPKRVGEMLTKAQSTLGYLKIVTPKHMRKSEGSEGSTRIVFGTVDGVTKTSKPVTNWTGSNLDPDSVARHHHLLKRGGFKGNADAKGVF